MRSNVQAHFHESNYVNSAVCVGMIDNYQKGIQDRLGSISFVMALRKLCDL